LGHEALKSYIGLFTSSVLHEQIASDKTRPFIERVPPTFAAAENSEGFICRAKGDYIVSDSGQLTGIEYDKTPSFYLDPTLVVQTLSVWRDIESAWAYVYSGTHLDSLRRRTEWMQKPTFPQYVLWWRNTDTVPLFAEGVEWLEYLNEHGVTKNAFTFRQSFTQDGLQIVKEQTNQ
jgi:hypothetical protein